MKQENFRKWRWVLALCLIAALSGTAWAEPVIYKTDKEKTVLQDLPAWVSADVFGDVFPAKWAIVSDSVFPKGATAFENNSVTVDFVAGGGAVTSLDFVLGAHNGTNNVAVDENTVTVTKGLVRHTVFGAISRLGSATFNKVIVNGGTVGSPDAGQNLPEFFGKVYGGYVTSSDGRARGNTVTIITGTIHGEVVGGKVQGPKVVDGVSVAGTGEADENIVSIQGGNLYGKIFGGQAGSGDAVENKVSISSGTISLDADGKGIIGGWSQAGSADANIVEITSAVNHSPFIIGGKVADAALGDKKPAANNNKVTIDKNVAVTTDKIYGGEGLNASNNTVELLAGTLSGDTTALEIVGGKVADGTAANNNTVRIVGGVNFKGDVTLYGGKNGGTAAGQGNKLIIENLTVKPLKVKSINFNSYDITVKGRSSGDVILQVTDAVNLQNTTLKVFDFTLGTGGSYCLISADGEISSKPDTIYATDSSGKALELTPTLLDNKRLLVTRTKDSDMEIYVTGNFNFGEHKVGYDSITAKKISYSTTSATIQTASLRDGTAFETKASTGAVTTWTVVPKSDLPAGDYKDMLIVDFVGGALATAEVSIKIGTGGATDYSVTPVKFGEHKVGVSIAAQEIKYIPATAVIQTAELTSGTNFDVEQSGTTWTVVPKSGLAIGVYTDTLTVKFANGKEATAAVTLEISLDGGDDDDDDDGDDDDDDGVSGGGGGTVVTPGEVDPDNPGTVKAPVAAADLEKKIQTAIDLIADDGLPEMVTVSVTRPPTLSKNEFLQAAVALPVSSLRLAAGSKSEGQVNINIVSDVGQVQLGNAALKKLVEVAEDAGITTNVKLVVTKTEDKLISMDILGAGDPRAGAVNATIAAYDEPESVFDISFRDGNDENVKFDMDTTGVTVRLPYVLSADRDIAKVKVRYFKEAGGYEDIPSDTYSYSRANQQVVFKTSHLSIYAVYYDDPKRNVGGGGGGGCDAGFGVGAALFFAAAALAAARKAGKR
jgi:hypothetical protein